MKILFAKDCQKKILKRIKQNILILKQKEIFPCLAIIVANNDFATNIFIQNKIKLCETLGIKTKLFKFSSLITSNEIIKVIEQLNLDKNINGIIVQIPLYKNLNKEKIINTINPLKDVDCITSINVGKLWTAKNLNKIVKPCTCVSCLELLNFYKIKIAQKNIVIISRSNLIGKPLISLMLKNDATITICHSKTKNLKSICQKGDIVICAIGNAKYFNQSYFKNDAIILDVGTNWLTKEKKLCGDVNLSSFSKDKFKGCISPTPGGVGLLTPTILLQNLIFLTKKQNA